MRVCYHLSISFNILLTFCFHFLIFLPRNILSLVPSQQPCFSRISLPIDNTTSTTPLIRFHDKKKTNMKTLTLSISLFLLVLPLKPLEASFFGRHQNLPSSLTARESSFCGSHHMPCPVAEPCCNSTFNFVFPSSIKKIHCSQVRVFVIH